MTPAQQQTYYRQFFRWHQQQERVAVRLVLARFITLQDSLSTLLLRSSPSVLLATLDLYITTDFHQSMLQAIYLATGTTAAEREYDRLTPIKAAADEMLVKDRDRLEPNRTGGSSTRSTIMTQIHHNTDKFRQRILLAVRSSATVDRVRSMTAKTVSLVRDVLTAGIAEVWPITRFISRMREVVVDRGRALLIARTEVTRAASIGSEVGAEATDMKLFKKWVALRDDRTRQDHAEMNDKPAIAPDALFSVGGQAMKYPGDPAGGAGQTINCRCSLIHVPAPSAFDN